MGTDILNRQLIAERTCTAAHLQTFARVYYGFRSRKVFNSGNYLNSPVYTNNWLIPVGLDPTQLQFD